MSDRPYPGIPRDTYERLLRREAVAAAERAGCYVACPCGHAYLDSDGACPACIREFADVQRRRAEWEHAWSLPGHPFVAYGSKLHTRDCDRIAFSRPGGGHDDEITTRSAVFPLTEAEAFAWLSERHDYQLCRVCRPVIATPRWVKVQERGAQCRWVLDR